MQISVRNLLIEAFSESNITVEGVPLRAKDFKIGIKCINGVVRELNLNNNLVWTRYIEEVTNANYNAARHSYVLASNPINITRVILPTGEDLIKVSYDDIMPLIIRGYNSCNNYAFNRSFEDTDEQSNIVLKSEILIDGNYPGKLTVMCNKCIDDYDENGVLNIPNEYYDIFVYGIAVKLMIRYNIDPNFIELKRSVYNARVSDIKTANAGNAPLTYARNSGRYSSILRRE